MKVVCDIEANGLLHDATQVWCIVCVDVDTKQVYKFSDSKALTEYTLADFKSFADKCTLFIGHNFMAYDIWVLKKVLGIKINPNKVCDTIILSRLFNPNQVLGHSLERWARFLKLPYQKVKHEDWSKLSPEMLHRCVVDAKINVALYHNLMKYTHLHSEQSIKLEHQMQYLLTENSIVGVKINIKKALDLFNECSSNASKIESRLDEEFPPVKKLIRKFKPRLSKDGTLHKTDQRTLDKFIHTKHKDGTVSLYHMIPFNPGSPKQVVERLDKAGWNPVDFNKVSDTMAEKGITKGTPKVNERNLDTIPDDAPQGARLIRDYLMFKSRAATVKQWIDAIDENERLHGNVISIGAWTQRCSHNNPNTANIPGVKKDAKTNEVIYGAAGRYGWECRDCWTVDDPTYRRLIGVDAKGIQLRVLAHYMGDKDYTDVILNGDPHSLHRDLLGLTGDPGRQKAKRFIYAWLLGAGRYKIAEILDCNVKEADERIEMFLDRLPKLAQLKKIQAKDARRGYFIGLDGRRIPAPSEHLVMSGYLQGGEAVIMKSAYVWSTLQFKKRKLDCNIVTFTHDEFQADTHLTNVEECGIVLVESIGRTTELFKLKCPMEGDKPKIGLSWAETH